jgi:hypothetical protein
LKTLARACGAYKVAISSERRMWIHYRDTKGTEFDKEARKAGGRAQGMHSGFRGN